MTTEILPHLPSTYLRRLLLRGVIFWALARTVLIALLSMGRDSHPLEHSLTLSMVLAIAFVVAALSFVEIQFRRERIFNANLGIAFSWFVALPAGVSVLLDAATIILMQMTRAA